MKKIAIILAASMAIAASTTAFAATAEYGSTNNQVTVDNTNGYSTVLITRDTDGEKVYVNQAKNVFTSSVAFLLQDGATEGDYTVLLGNASGGTSTASFTIAAAASDEKTKQEMTKLAEESSGDGTYKLAFTITDDISDYNIITIKVGDKMGGFYISDVFGNITGDVNLGLQINNVPEAYKNDIEVYLGTGTLGQSYGDWSAE